MDRLSSNDKLLGGGGGGGGGGGEGVLQQLIDEETLGVCLELHRAIKLNYYDLLYPDKSAIESHEVVDRPGFDVFGNTVQMLRKPVECVCPSCGRTLGATKFAPHLEKCLGLGRGRSRLAHKKTVAIESEGDGSEDNEEEWTYPEKKPRKMKREKIMGVSPRKVTSGKALKRERALEPSYSNNGGGGGGGGGSGSSDGFYQLKPSLQQHNIASFTALPADYQVNLLQQICAVVSERTGRLCTRSVNCPQHTEEQRADVRKRLQDHSRSLDINHSPASPASSSSSSSHKHFKDSYKYTSDDSHVKDYYDQQQHSNYQEPLRQPMKKNRDGSKKHKRHSNHYQ